MPKAAGNTTRRKPAAAPANQPALEVDEDATDDWFTDLDDVKDYINALFYGNEGGGKTTDVVKMVNSRPNGRVVVINAEGGLKKSALQKRGVDTSRVQVWPKPGQRITRNGIDALYRKLRADLENDPESWIGVVWDSATDIAQVLVDDIQKKRVNALKNKGVVNVDENHVDIADYGDMAKQFRDLLRKFRDLPCHFAMTALMRRDVDKDTGLPSYGPAVIPSLATDLLGYVDFVLMIKAEDEDGPFRALTKKSGRYRAKDRFDVLPRVFAEPSMDRIIAYLDGDLTAETDPIQAQITERAKKSQDKTPDGDEALGETPDEDDEEDSDSDDE